MTKADQLRAEGRHCRDLADGIGDERARHILLQLSTEYEAEAVQEDIGIVTGGHRGDRDAPGKPPEKE
jgi:hypothetical protein